MSDTPKVLRRVTRLRWILLGCALLLTVATGVAIWAEVVNGLLPALRSLIWGTTMIFWFAFIASVATVFVCRRFCAQIKRMEDRTDDLLAKAKERQDRTAQRIVDTLLDAIREERISKLAGLMDETGNVRSLKERR